MLSLILGNETELIALETSSPGTGTVIFASTFKLLKTIILGGLSTS